MRKIIICIILFLGTVLLFFSLYLPEKERYGKFEIKKNYQEVSAERNL